MRNFLRLSTTLMASLSMAALFSGCVVGQDDSSSLDGTALRQDGQPNSDAPATPGAGTVKVDICHIPPGNPENVQYITVGSPAYDAHMAHGDQACSEIDDESDDVTPPQDTTDDTGSDDANDTEDGGTAGTGDTGGTDTVVDPST